MKIYVNGKVGRDGDGTKERPFRRINDTAKIARPGDEVLVSPGVYREYVDPIYAGTEEAGSVTGAQNIWEQLLLVRKESVLDAIQGECLVCRVANSLLELTSVYHAGIWRLVFCQSR